MRQPLVVIALLLWSTHLLASDCKPNATPEQISALLERAEAQAESERSEHEDVILFVTHKPDGSVIQSYFTKDNHAAHPAQVVQAFFEKDGKVWAYARGNTAGDCRIFIEWMRSFEARQQELQRRMQESSQSSESRRP